MTNMFKMCSDGCFSTCKLLDLESSQVEVHEDRGTEEFRLLFASSRIGNILLFLYYLGTLHLYPTCQQSLRNVVFSLDFHFSCAIFCRVVASDANVLVHQNFNFFSFRQSYVG